MAAKAAARPDPYQAQAQLAAQVRYQPQQQALKALLAQAVQTYLNSVASSQSAGRAVRASALQAKPEIARDMVPIGGSIDAANAMVAPQAAGTAFGGAIAHDAAGTHNRLAQMLAQAQIELTDRAQNAAAGTQYQVSKLGQDYAATQAKVGQQLADLAGQQGAFTASQLDSLHQSAAGRAVTKRGQNLSHADRVANANSALDKIDPQTGLSQRELMAMSPSERQTALKNARNATGHGPKAKSPYLPNVSQSKAQGTIDAATSDAQRLLGLKGPGGKAVYDPPAVARLLADGRPKTSVYPAEVTLGGKTYKVDENSGMALDSKGAAVPGPDGKPYRVAKIDLPAIKKYDPAVVQAAIDKITQGGQYTPETVQALRRRGIKTPGPARPKGATAYGGPH